MDGKIIKNHIKTKNKKNCVTQKNTIQKNNNISNNRSINMSSIIKEKINNNVIEEEKIQISNIQPSDAPKKPNKCEVESLEKIIENRLNIASNEGKEGRLKAYNIMKKNMTKQDINQMINNTNEPLNSNVYCGNIYVNEKPDFVNITNKSNLSLINQFDNYLNNKFEPKDEDFSIHTNNNNFKNFNEIYNIKLSYLFGINSNSDAICFHKKEKWVGYLNKNLILIENFQNEENRTQHILDDSKVDLDTLKLSENGKILFAYSKQNSQIIFYNYFVDDNLFKLINTIFIKHKSISDCEISPQNNLCIVISK